MWFPENMDVVWSNPEISILSFFWAQQMDNAVYTFEQLLHQNMEEQSGEELNKTIHRCQDRVLKVNQPGTCLNLH